MAQRVQRLHHAQLGLDAYLRDAAIGQATKLSVGYSFSVTTAETQALLGGRFTLQFTAASPLATVSTLTATIVTLYPSPARESFAVAVPAVAGAATV